jgi:hypothetical protein
MLESTMNREIWIGLLLVVIAAILGLWFFRSYILQLSEPGFRIYSIENNALLISDADILSYNWTNQEMAITPEASERLTALGDLYSFTGFVIKIDGEEIYRGIFREYTMSALPASPRISISARLRDVLSILSATERSTSKQRENLELFRKNQQTGTLDRNASFDRKSH